MERLSQRARMVREHRWIIVNAENGRFYPNPIVWVAITCKKFIRKF
jgi:phage terminase small subunit